MAEESPFKRSLAPAGSAVGGQYSRLSAFRNDPVTNSVTAKLLEGMMPTRFNAYGSREIELMGDIRALQITDDTAGNIADARNMQQLLPDLTLAKQVLISSIISPNDMMSSELLFSTISEELGELTGPMLDVIRNHFTGVYKIEAIMSKQLECMLFDTGSYPMAILPESSIDDIINSPMRVGVESIRGEFDGTGRFRKTGILGSNADASAIKPSLESLGLESVYRPQVSDQYDDRVGVESFMLTVTDNPSTLKYPILKDKISQDRIHDMLGMRSFGMENSSRLSNGTSAMTDETLRQSLYRQRTYKNVPVLPVKTLSELDKPTVGHPLVMTLPAESVIPVHVPSNPDEHIGYFILLDRTGNPVNKAFQSDYYRDLTNGNVQTREMVSQLVRSAAGSINGFSQFANQQMEYEQATAVYTSIVERDLHARLRNGIYGDNVEISKPQEIFRIMLARACARMYTQLLYIPKEMMVYYAFDYNKYGVGKSLVEDTKILGAIRGMLLFADTMAAIKNSISHTQVMIDLDPKDPDPGRTVEFLLHEHAKLRQGAYPIGTSNPRDMINYLQNAGIQAVIKGHPGFMETQLSVEDKQMNKTRVDGDLQEMLKKRHLQAFAVPPETVDLSQNVDFATSVVQSNILLAKRAAMYGKIFSAFETDFVQKYTRSSSVLMDKLRKIVEEGRAKLKGIDPEGKMKTDNIVHYFISTVELSLPEPDMTKIEVQMKAFTAYSEALDKILPNFISSELFDTNNMGEVGNSINMTVAVVKAYYLRRWLKENNVLPELFEMIAENKEDTAVLDILEMHNAYLESVSGSLRDFLKRNKKTVDKNNDVAKTIGGITETQPASDAGGGGADDMGGGDAGLDFDFGGDAGGGEDTTGGAGATDTGAPEEEPAAPEEGGAEKTGGDTGEEGADKTGGDAGKTE